MIPETCFSLILACLPGRMSRKDCRLTLQLANAPPVPICPPPRNPQGRRSLTLVAIVALAYYLCSLVFSLLPSPSPQPPSPMPQSPTCSGIKIRSVRDAQVILYACHIGRLEMIKMRLDTADRHALASGNVYAWEERSPRSDPMGSGIERFTEGKRWTASRLRDVRRHPPDSPISHRPQSSLPPTLGLSLLLRKVSPPQRARPEDRVCRLISVAPSALAHLPLFQQPAKGLGSFREADLLRMGQYREWKPKVAPE